MFFGTETFGCEPFKAEKPRASCRRVPAESSLAKSWPRASKAIFKRSRGNLGMGSGRGDRNPVRKKDNEINLVKVSNSHERWWLMVVMS